MKGVLRKVNDGIVFTIDERPKMGDWWYHSNGVINNLSNELNDPDYEDCHKILASTFGVGLELYMLLEQEMDLILPLEDCLHIEFNTEYPYTIQDNKVIIEL